MEKRAAIVTGLVCILLLYIYVPIPQFSLFTFLRSVFSPRGIYHCVTQGQSLWIIAQGYGISVDDIVRTNRLSSSSVITHHQLLFIPCSSGMRYPLKETFLWPVYGELVSSYGHIYHAIPNKGIDIKVSETTLVKASRSGKVCFVSEACYGYEKIIILDHQDGYYTVYSHLSSLLVKEGQEIRQGAYIGSLSGGTVNEPSLHFEIRKSYIPCNPLYYIAPWQEDSGSVTDALI